MLTQRFQRTLRNKVVFEGKGLHSGMNTRVTCLPAGLGHGMVFERTDAATPRAWKVGEDALNLPAGGVRRSIVGSASQTIDTVEHLMAALWALGISNLRIEVHGSEIPALDGSALDFVNRFTEAGLVDQPEPRERFMIQEPIFVSAGKAAILMMPHESFRVTYTLDYRQAGLRQIVALEMDEMTFVDQIAPARTFCTEEESRSLLEQGYGKGATYHNTLVVGPKGPVNNTYRFNDECARHKVLDLVGDLGLLGMDLGAHVIALRSGHGLNNALISRIHQLRRQTHAVK